MKSIRSFLFLAISAILICCANTSSKKADATAENAGAPSVSASVAENTPTDVKGLGLVGNVKEVSVTVCEISPEPGEPWIDSVQVMRFDENGRVLKDRYDNLYKYDDKGNFVFGLSAKTKMRRDENGRIVYYENRQDEEDDLGFHINFEYDGNGRMSRLLSLLLLYKAGFDAGKYISFEEQINKSKGNAIRHRLYPRNI